MKTFDYLAIDTSKQKIKGQITAQNESQAKNLLKSKQFIILDLKEKKTPWYHYDRQPSVQDICLFTRQLATFLASGISLSDALHGMAQEQSHPIMRHVIDGIYQKVLEGYSLAQALKQYPKIFSNLYQASIYAGEQSGQLNQVLEQLANYIEQQYFAQQKIKQALIYPSLMISVATLIIIFLMTQVVPKILAIFDDNQQALPLMTRLLMGMSHGIKFCLPFFIVVIVVIATVAYSQKDNIHWKRRWHQKLIELSFYKKLIKISQIPRYLHTLHILLSSGVNVLESMNVANQLITNILVKEKFIEAAQKVKEGYAISKSLAQTDWLNHMTIHLIQSGEKSGQIAQMLERSAQQIDVQRQQFIDTGLKLLEPIIILLMGGFVLFVVLAILLPIFQMQQLV